MKRDIFDLLGSYTEESVELTGDTPLSASRIRKLTMAGIGQNSRGERPERGGRNIIRSTFSRSLLIAAVVGSLCCLTAFAIVYSLRDAARADMGVSTAKPIPEWTEYEDGGSTDGEAEGTHASLLATMCSGQQVYAYFEVSPVPEEIAAAIHSGSTSPLYEWDLSGISASGCGYFVKQTDYDAETQTALVKVNLRGEGLATMEQLELELVLTRDLKEVQTYGTVMIPVTESESISCPADEAVVNTKAHFEMAWRADFPPLDIPDYASEGRIRRISVFAGYIEVELETPDMSQWFRESNAQQAGLEDERKKEVLFCNNWIISVNETLKDAALNYTDGTHDLIAELPRDYAAAWQLDHDYVDTEGKEIQVYRFIPKQAIDLSLVESVTVCGTEYSFQEVDENLF